MSEPSDLAPVLGGAPMAWPFKLAARPVFVMPEVAERLAADEAEHRRAMEEFDRQREALLDVDRGRQAWMSI